MHVLPVAEVRKAWSVGCRLKCGFDEQILNLVDSEACGEARPERRPLGHLFIRRLDFDRYRAVETE